MYSDNPWTLDKPEDKGNGLKKVMRGDTGAVQTFLKDNKKECFTTSEISSTTGIKIDKVRKAVKTLYEIGQINIVRVQECGIYSICGLYQDIEGPLTPISFTADSPELDQLYNYFLRKKCLSEEEIFELYSLAKTKRLQKFLVKKEGTMNLYYKYRKEDLDNLYEELHKEDSDKLNKLYEEYLAGEKRRSDLIRSTIKDYPFDPYSDVVFDPTTGATQEIETNTPEDDIDENLVFTANKVSKELNVPYRRVRRILRKLAEKGEIRLTIIKVNNRPLDGYYLPSDKMEKLRHLLITKKRTKKVISPKIKDKPKSFNLFGFEITFRKSSN